VASENAEMVRFLVDAGADISIANEIFDLLFAYMGKSTWGSNMRRIRDIIRILIHAGMDVSFTDRNAMSVLHRLSASRYGGVSPAHDYACGILIADVVEAVMGRAASEVPVTV
jgi:hypothetical protein